MKEHYINSHGDNCPEGIKYQEARKYENGVRSKLWNNKRAYTTIKEMKAILYNNENSEKVNQSSEKNSFSCKMCEYVGGSEELLSMHVKVVHIHTSVTNFKFICNICFHQTKFQWSMTKHRRLVHKIIEESPLKCDKCGKSFTAPENMKRHVKYNLCGDNPIPIPKIICESCGKSFTTSGHLKTHVKNIHEENDKKKNVCDFCGKSFSEARKLKGHIYKVHEGRKDFKCDSCAKSFTEAHNLRKHIRTIHEGSRDHKCDSCDKSFFQAGKLKQHIHTVHEGHRDHICDSCGKSFATPASLRTHFQRRHEDRIKMESPNYQCETCGKKLISEAGLKKHIKVKKRNLKESVPFAIK